MLSAPELLECEESSIIESLKKSLVPLLTSPEDEMRVRNLIRELFPTNARPKTGADAYPPTLVTCIKNQMRQNNLQHSDAMLLKVNKTDQSAASTMHFEQKHVNVKQIYVSFPDFAAVLSIASQPRRVGVWSVWIWQNDLVSSALRSDDETALERWRRETR